MDKFAVVESRPRGEAIAAFAIPLDFTSSSCSGVDLAPEIGFVLAFQDHSSGTPQNAAAGIFEIGHVRESFPG